MSKKLKSKQIRKQDNAHEKVISEFNDIFCSAPFTHIHIGPETKATTCCKSRTPLGDIADSKIEDLYNDDFAKDIRKAMLEGKQHWQCKNCYRYENEAGQHAENRISSNYQSEPYIQEIKDNVLPDGTLKSPTPTFVDILWTNKCNFACLGCTPELSTTINNVYKEEFAIINGQTLDTYHPEITGEWQSGNEEKIRYVLKNADKIKFIHMQGGEPFLTTDIYDFMDAMIEAGIHKKINILAHTNGSISKNYKGKDLVNDYLKFWGNKAKINLSIDGIEKRGEYIRYGFKNDIWENTLNKMLDSNILVGVSSRINIFNVATLDEFGSYVNRVKPLESSGWQNCNLKAWFNDSTNISLIKIHEPTRKNTVDMLNNMLKTNDHPVEWGSTIPKWINWLENDKMPTKKDVTDLVKGIEAFDKKRKIQFDDTFPELAEWKKCAIELIS